MQLILVWICHQISGYDPGNYNGRFYPVCMTYSSCGYLWQEIDYHSKSVEIRCQLAVLISHKFISWVRFYHKYFRVEIRWITVQCGFGGNVDVSASAWCQCFLFVWVFCLESLSDANMFERKTCKTSFNCAFCFQIYLKHFSLFWQERSYRANFYFFRWDSLGDISNNLGNIFM